VTQPSQIHNVDSALNNLQKNLNAPRSERTTTAALTELAIELYRAKANFFEPNKSGLGLSAQMHLNQRLSAISGAPPGTMKSLGQSLAEYGAALAGRDRRPDDACQDFWHFARISRYLPESKLRATVDNLEKEVAQRCRPQKPGSARNFVIEHIAALGVQAPEGPTRLSVAG
jgi:hypothetical protein